MLNWYVSYGEICQNITFLFISIFNSVVAMLWIKWLGLGTKNTWLWRGKYRVLA